MTQVTNDQSLDNALKACLAPHFSLCVGEENEILGRYYGTLNEIECAQLSGKYLESVEFHEIMHYFLSVNTSFRRLYIFYELEIIDTSKELSGLLSSGKEYVRKLWEPIQEAFTHYFQLMQPSIPVDLKEGILNVLKQGNKKLIGSLLIDLGIILNRIEEHYYRKEVPTDKRFTLALNMSRAILSVPYSGYLIPYRGPYQRLRLLNELTEKHIPEWKDIDTVVDWVVEEFHRNQLTFYNGDAYYSNFRDRALENLSFWSWCCHMFNNVDEKITEQFIFGILSELDISFHPSLYTFASSSQPRKMRRCLMRDIKVDSFMLNTYLEEINNLPTILDIKNISSEEKNYILSIAQRYQEAMTDLAKQRVDIFKKCPVKCDFNCVIKEDLIQVMKGVKSEKFFAWPR